MAKLPRRKCANKECRQWFHPIREGQIHLQCDVCNVYKSGNIEAYRTALVERYGEAAVLALENNNTPHRWTVEELKEIRLAALADLRALKKLEAA
ncbi:DNA breaking-rejoining protein [Salmonella enterica]|nr:DNA breaking-rejoining protein [Salmonella enterica]